MAVGRVSLDTGDRNMLLMITIIAVSFLLVASATILYQGVSTLSTFIAILPLAISGVLGCVLDRRWVVLAVCATVAIVAAIILPESVPAILGVTLGLEGISYLSHLIVMVLFPILGSSGGPSSDRWGRKFCWILCVEHLGRDATVSFRPITRSVRESMPEMLLTVSIPLMSFWILIESCDPLFNEAGSFIGAVVCIALYSLPFGLVYVMLARSGMGVSDGPRIHNVAEGVLRTVKRTALILAVLTLASVLLSQNGVSVFDSAVATAIMASIAIIGLILHSNHYAQAFIDTIVGSEEFPAGTEDGASSRYDDLPGTPTRDDGLNNSGRQRYL